METNLENIRKVRYWAELPLEMARGIGTEILRLVDLAVPPEQPIDITPANIQYFPPPPPRGQG